MFESRVLRRIFGLEKEDVAGGWRKLHSEELCNFDHSLNIIRVNKSRNMRWEDEKCIQHFMQKIERDIGIDGRIMLKWMSNSGV
jgi:hypothetical protein